MSGASGPSWHPPVACRAALLAALVAAALAGCSGGSGPAAGTAAPTPGSTPSVSTGPTAPSATPTPTSVNTSTPPASADTSAPVTPPTSAPSRLGALPTLTLPRLGVPGSQRLDAVPAGTPTVVNLWASWCGPCKQEMPEIQAVADSAGERVRFFGVLTKDPGDGWRETLKETAAQYLSLRDDDGAFLARLGVPPALPVTVFARADGSIAFVYQGPALTRTRLSQLVTEHLGVAL